MSGKYAGQKIRVVTAEIRRDGTYLITQRLPSSILPLLWEFPGGRVREGERGDPRLASTRRAVGPHSRENAPPPPGHVKGAGPVREVLHGACGAVSHAGQDHILVACP